MDEDLVEAFGAVTLREVDILGMRACEAFCRACPEKEPCAERGEPGPETGGWFDPVCGARAPGEFERAG